MKKRVSLKIILALIALSALLALVLSRLPRNVLNASRVEITYAAPSYDSRYPDKRARMSTIVSETDDKTAVLQILSRMEHSEGGNCPFGVIVLQVYDGNSVLKYDIGVDECGLVKCDNSFFRIRAENLLAFKRIIPKYAPHPEWKQLLEEWANIPPAY